LDKLIEEATAAAYEAIQLAFAHQKAWPQDAKVAEHNIDFRPCIRGTAIHRQAKTVALSDGSTESYDVLILATGARAIALPIPGADLEGVMFLRTAADAEALKARVGPAKTLAVVGGGYIGLEVAASGRGLGAEVVVLEREDRLLARVACETLSSFFKTYHEQHGVTFELGAAVMSFEGEAGHVVGVRLADGRIIACDSVVVGVGATPNDELARDSGLDVARGVVVDLEARTSDPSIFAIGDPNALEGAKQVASAIVGRPPPAGEVPWQWSDQYDLKLQIAGYAFDVDQIVVRGDPSKAKFAVFHLRGGRVQSVEAINSPAEFMMGKRLIGERRQISKTKLADPSVSMKEVAD